MRCKRSAQAGQGVEHIVIQAVVQLIRAPFAQRRVAVAVGAPRAEAALALAADEAKAAGACTGGHTTGPGTG